MGKNGSREKITKISDVIKLTVIVVVITLLVILIALNFRQPLTLRLIVATVITYPSVLIIVSFLTGVLFTLLVMLVRRAKKR